MSAAEVLLRTKETVHAFIPQWSSHPEKLRELERSGLQLHEAASMNLPARLRVKLARRLNPRDPALLAGSFRQWRELVSLKDATALISANDIPSAHPVLQAFRRGHLRYACLYQLIAESAWPSDEMMEEMRAALSEAAGVYFVSHQNRELLERMMGGSLAKAKVIRNEGQPGLRVSQPWPEERMWRIAFVGRISFFHKGLDMLLQVLERPEWRTRVVEFHLVGAGENSECARRWIARGQLKNVFLRGYQKDVLAVWQSCHALILPSRMEGFSLALVEAMSCGRVPIVTPVGDAGAVIQDGESGFVAASISVQGLGDVLERAWSQRTRWRQIGVAASKSLPSAGNKSAGEILAEELMELRRRSSSSSL